MEVSDHGYFLRREGAENSSEHMVDQCLDYLRKGGFEVGKVIGGRREIKRDGSVEGILDECCELRVSVDTNLDKAMAEWED